MTAQPVAVQSGRLRAQIVTAMVVTAFVVGTLTGFNLPSAFGGGLSPKAEATIAESRNFTGVAVNNMTDAALREWDNSSVQPPTFVGVAVNNMTDAARRAIYGAEVLAPSFAGVADNNMSDAARRVIYGAEVGDH